MYYKPLLASFVCLALSFAAGQCAYAQSPAAQSPAATAHSPAGEADTAFVQQAAKGGLAEVSLSQLAVTAASSPELREFAQKMVTEHSANNRELADAASKAGISVPKETDQEHQRLQEKLSTLRGPSFDTTYVNAMVQDHEKMVELLQSSSKTVSSPELRAYIDKTLPVVRGHLEMAQKLRK